MHDVALPVLTRWRVPELIRARNLLAAEYTALLRNLEHARHTSAWWERAVFGDERDAAPAPSLPPARECAWSAITKAEREATAAVSGAANEHLPIEIAWRVEQIVQSVLLDPSVGRVRCERELEIIALLDALATRVASLWLTNYSPEQLGHAIAHMTRSELAAPVERLPELRTDERLGWAAIDIQELVARAMAPLASGPAAAARARLQKERASYERVTHALVDRASSASECGRAGSSPTLAFGRKTDARRLLTEKVVSSASSAIATSPCANRAHSRGGGNRCLAREPFLLPSQCEGRHTLSGFDRTRFVARARESARHRARARRLRWRDDLRAHDYQAARIPTCCSGSGKPQ